MHKCLLCGYKWKIRKKFPNPKYCPNKKCKSPRWFREKLPLKGINAKEKNGQWKGDKVKKGPLHDYIKYHLKKSSLCDCCHKVPPYDLANISQEYKRDISDWEWLCRSCHMKKDGRANALHCGKIREKATESLRKHYAKKS